MGKDRTGNALRRVARAFRFIASGLLLMLAAAALALAIAFLSGIRPYIVKSGSMQPFLPVGSLCFVDRRADFSDISTGDIILYRRGAMRVIHRVTSVTEEGLETKGDANFVRDGILVTAEACEGKYLFHIAGAGAFVLWARTPRGIAICAAILLVFLSIEISFGGEDNGEEGSKPKKDAGNEGSKPQKDSGEKGQ